MAEAAESSGSRDVVVFLGVEASGLGFRSELTHQSLHNAHYQTPETATEGGERQASRVDAYFFPNSRFTKEKLPVDSFRCRMLMNRRPDCAAMLSGFFFSAAS